MTRLNAYKPFDPPVASSSYARPTKAGARVSTNSYWPLVLMLAFGFGWAIALELQFRVYLSELVVLAALPFLRWRNLFGDYRALGRVMMCLSLWLVAIISSDLYNQTALIDTLRAGSTPLIAAASLLFALACIHRNARSLITFFFGIALGKFIYGEPFYGEEWASRAIDLTSLFELNYFKARIEPFLTPALLLGLVWLGRKRPNRAILPALIIGIAYILLDARSVGLFFLAASGVFFLDLRGRRFSRPAIAIGAALLVAAFFALFTVYADYALRNNPTSQTGMQLARVENPYNPVELLRVGRSEWSVMPDAIAERPIMGWGSWAIDPRNRYNFLEAERVGGLYIAAEQFEGPARIPFHSVIAAAWLWSGLLGLASMVWLTVVLVRLGKAAGSRRTIQWFLTLFLSAQMAWALLFSPPQSVRTQFPIAIAMLLYLGSGAVERGYKIPIDARRARRRF